MVSSTQFLVNGMPVFSDSGLEQIPRERGSVMQARVHNYGLRCNRGASIN